MNLTKNDKDLIEKLLNLDKEIYNSYNLLANYEINNETLKYEEEKEKLKKLIDFEDSIYKLENLTEKRIIDISIYCSNMIRYIYEEDIHDKKTDLSYKRILMKIGNIITDKDDKNKILKNFLLIDNTRTEMLYLNETIKTINKTSLKNALIKNEKYEELFINPCIEQELLDNNFTFTDKNIYESAKLISSYLNIDSSIYEDLKTQYLLKCIIGRTKTLLLIPNTLTFFDDIKAISITHKCHIKAALIYLDNDIIEKLKEDVLSKDENRVNYNMVKEAFNEVDDDKKNLVNVSLIRRK